MAERWETVNQLAMPLDEAFGMGLEAMKRVGLYDPFRAKVYEVVRAMKRREFLKNNDLEVIGHENIPETGGAVLVVNHQSWLDVQVVVAALERRVHFVAKAMFQDWPFLHHLIEMTDSLFIRRGGDAEGLKDVTDALKDGKLVCVFPEGTIPGEEDIARWEVDPKTGLLKGKTGAVRLAMLAGVPIIPIGLSGPGRVLPPEVYPRLQALPPRGEQVKLTANIGKPFAVPTRTWEELDRKELRKTTDNVMKKLSKLIDFSRHYEPITLPIKPKKEPGRVPTYALRSEPRTAKRKAPYGVLALHGFTAHVSCVSGIEDALKERGVPYRFPVLRGHGTTPEDLRGVSYQDWYQDGEDALLDLLTECRKVIIVGHSMGGLVTLELAARHGDKLAGIVAAAPALKFADPMSFLTPVLSKLVKSWPSPKAYHDAECAKRNQNYPKFPVDAFVQLYRYAPQVANQLSFVKVPTVILHSKKDQVISPKAARIAYDRISAEEKEIVWFADSGHEMFLDLEAERVIEETAKAIDRFMGKSA